MSRMRARISAEQSKRLEDLTRAREARDEADADYRRALISAYESGLTYRAMAERAGTTGEAVRRMINRSKTPSGHDLP